MSRLDKDIRETLVAALKQYRGDDPVSKAAVSFVWMGGHSQTSWIDSNEHYSEWIKDHQARVDRALAFLED